MKKLLIATSNKHKIEEIAAIFQQDGLDIELVGLDSLDNYQAPEEDGDSFIANAQIKAVSAARSSGLPALADDSGLEVDALNGEPGIYSARYAGIEQDDAANRHKLLANLSSVPAGKRQGAFVCAAVLAIPQQDGEVNCFSTVGCCYGEIAFEEKGEFGFGYDNLFYLPEYQQTMAELTPNQKNKISHRYLAMKKMTDIIKAY